MARTKKNTMSASQVLMGLSLVAVIMAGVGYLVGDIWLASTQWLLVAGVLGLFGIYFKEK